jgi:hypothetical protein
MVNFDSNVLCYDLFNRSNQFCQICTLIGLTFFAVKYSLEESGKSIFDRFVYKLYIASFFMATIILRCYYKIFDIWLILTLAQQARDYAAQLDSCAYLPRSFLTYFHFKPQTLKKERRYK